MSSRIEQIIDEIEDYIESCKPQPFSTSKIIVNRDELEDLLAELRRKTPDEIKRYQKIISNKEAILADAQAKADAIIAEAQVYTSELVSEHQIMQQAYAKANEVVLIADNEAQAIRAEAEQYNLDMRTGAIEYADGVLKSLEEIIAHAMDTTQARTDNLMKSLQSCYDLVDTNRNELKPEPEEVPAPVKSEEQEQEEEIPQMEVSADLLNQ